MQDVDTVSGVVKSDRTLFRIIDALHRLESAGVTELADEIDSSKSTVHKHLKTLEHMDYVVNEDGVYRLGLRFFTYGAGVTVQSDLAQLLESKVTDLIEKTDEIIVASLEENGIGTFIAIDNDNYNLQQASNLGSRFHLNMCASGKAILAEFSDDKIEDLVDRYGLPGNTAKTVTSREALFGDIEVIRERGYATNIEEMREGLSAVGAAVHHPITDEYGALAISGPSHRMTPETIESEYADVLLEAVNELELQMNYG